MSKKNEVLNDTYKFQRACDAFVRQNIIYCVSGLIYELREVAEQLDDYETYMTLTGGRPDYEEAARYFIMDEADLNQLEEVVESWGYWDDLLDEVKGEFPNLLKHYTVTVVDEDGDDDEHDCWARDEDHAIEQALEAHPGCTAEATCESDGDLDECCDVHVGLEQAIREKVWMGTTNYEEVCNDHDLDPEYNEPYEFWICDRYFGARLRECGEIVEEYLGLLIWARTCSGQAIAMDGVICEMVRDLDEDHWVWGEA